MFQAYFDGRLAWFAIIFCQDPGGMTIGERTTDGDLARRSRSSNQAYARRSREAYTTPEKTRTSRRRSDAKDKGRSSAASRHSRWLKRA